MLIFDTCLSCDDFVKYGRDLPEVTDIAIILKNWEITERKKLAWQPPPTEQVKLEHNS